MSTILIIDDDPDLRCAIAVALAAQAFEVIEAESVDAGVRAARHRLPDLVLCDLHLGTGFGWDVLEELRRTPATAAIPLILMTASDDQSIMRRSMNLGADDFLRKPFTAAQLQTAVKARLRKQGALKAQAEQANQQLLGLLEATGDLVALVDPLTLVVRYMNRAARRLTGLDPGRPGEPVLLAELYPPQAFSEVEGQALPSALRDGAWRGETDVATANDGRIHILQEIIVHRAVDGAVDYLSIVGRDITERRRIERDLRQSEERFRLLFESSRDALMTMAPPSWKFTSCNQAALELFGVPDESSLALLGPWDLSPAMQPNGFPSAQQAHEMLATALREGSCFFEWTHQRLGGGEFPATVLLTRLELAGQPMIQATVRDITEAKRAEAERGRMEVQLRHSQKLQAIGQLAAGIAHEINTPVQFIGDNTRFLGDVFGGLDEFLGKCADLIEAGRQQAATAELVAECGALWGAADLDYVRAEVPAALRQTLEGVERISKIVRAMKDFSHPGTGEKSLVDLNKLVESTLTVCHNEWKYVADLVTEFDPTLTAVPCLPGEFNQVILNLVVNAAHAIGDALKPGVTSKGTLTVTTRRIERWAEVRISDTGTGIPESARPHIFEPFFTTKDVGRGTGQGLAIAHSVITDKHGGTIRFETEVGRGTTFILRLPLVAPLAAKTAAAKISANPSPTPELKEKRCD